MMQFKWCSQNYQLEKLFRISVNGLPFALTAKGYGKDYEADDRFNFKKRIFCRSSGCNKWVNRLKAAWNKGLRGS